MALIQPAPRTPAPVVNYYEAGYNAYRLGCTSFNCPYPAGDKRATEWIRGYGAAKQSKAKLFNPPPAPKKNFKDLQRKMKPAAHARSKSKAARLAKQIDRRSATCA